jgi:hypothetical protein
MNGEQEQFDALDILSILSFYIGLENLSENRQQSAHNDVQIANNKQAAYLLAELTKKFDEQNKMLQKILEVLTNENTN